MYIKFKKFEFNYIKYQNLFALNFKNLTSNKNNVKNKYSNDY